MKSKRKVKMFPHFDPNTHVITVDPDRGKYVTGTLRYCVELKRYFAHVECLQRVKSALPNANTYDSDNFCVTVAEKVATCQESCRRLCPEGLQTPFVNVFFQKINVRQGEQVKQAWRMTEFDIFFF
jgi:hypothetical protein